MAEDKNRKMKPLDVEPVQGLPEMVKIVAAAEAPPPGPATKQKDDKER